MLVSAAVPDRRVEDSYSARFRMGDGVEVALQNVGAAWTARGFVAVTGTAGTAGIDDGEAWIADADGTRPLVGPPGSVPIGGGRVDDDLDALGSYEIRHYEKLAAAFRAAIEGREIESPVDAPDLRRRARA